MSDFLSSLVDRALARAPVLERRRPSLFEPAAGMAPTGRAPSESSGLEGEQEIVLEVESSARERTIVETGQPAPGLEHESIRPASSAAGRESARAEEPRFSSSTVTGSETEARRVGQKQSEAPLKVESRPQPAAREETEARSSRKDAPAEQGFTTAPLRVTETIVEREVERPRVYGQPAERLHAHREQRQKQPVPPEPSPAIKPVVIQALAPREEDERKPRSSPEQKVESRIAIEPVRLPRNDLLRPTTGPRVPPPAPLSPRTPGTAPVTPTVQVTIGRIEVRATPPAAPAPARAARARAPKLSLDEYLKARGGGKK